MANNELEIKMVVETILRKEEIDRERIIIICDPVIAKPDDCSVYTTAYNKALDILSITAAVRVTKIHDGATKIHEPGCPL